MHLAISNIAWHPSEEENVARVLVEEGVRFVEVAPTRIAERPKELGESEVRKYRQFWSSHGMSVVAMQALLFGRPDLMIFSSEDNRRRTFNYLKRMIDIASRLGAKAVVFGSPKNRATHGLSTEVQRAIEREFFGGLGSYAAAAGMTFCVEPNPTVYGCDYIRTVSEAQALLARVPSEGLGLHIDTGGMTLEGEEPESLAGLDISHFHVSEPDLLPPGSRDVPHRRFASALRANGYSRWISIEMRQRGQEVDSLMTIREAVRWVQKTYALCG